MKTTLAAARKSLQPFNMTLRHNYGEYRVNHKGGKPATAYFTTDLDDAVATGKRMSHFATCATCEQVVHRGQMNGYSDCSECAKKKRDAKNFPKEFDLIKGDHIAIVGANGRNDITYYGVVIDAQYWMLQDGWYIEFTHTNNPWFQGGSPVGSYGYWKQGCDGGTVQKLETRLTNAAAAMVAEIGDNGPLANLTPEAEYPKAVYLWLNRNYKDAHPADIESAMAFVLGNKTLSN